jgi:outer membrane protein TolC
MVPTLLVALAATIPPPPLDLAAVRERSRPAPQLLAVETELAAAAAVLARSRGWRLDEATLSLEAGPRDGTDGTTADLAVALDVPVAQDRNEHANATAAWLRARTDLVAAASLEARLDLELAYVDAWLAGAVVRYREAELGTVERWHASVVERVRAGADAPYEATLLAAEVDATRVALAEARGAAAQTWAQLAARAEVGAQPIPLAEPNAAPPPTPAAATMLAPSVTSRAITSRADLDRALAELDAARDRSRWSLTSSLAREGDESVARFGGGYRLPLGDLTPARTRALAAQLAEIGRRAEVERAALEARRREAEAHLAALPSTTLLDASQVDQALVALTARLDSGRDRPSEVLPLRRQLQNAQVTSLMSKATRLRAAFTLATLNNEVTP